MIGYVTLGSNDLQRAARFYDQLLALVGGKRAMELERAVVFSASPTSPALTVIKPHDGNAATVGNGMMVGIAAQSRAQVDALHAKALALGARDEGAVGPRSEGFYAGYFRDLDGNKLAVYCIG